MDQNQKFWDRIARLYTPMQERANAALYAVVMDHCRPWLGADSDVLELACGTGQFTFGLCGGAASWTATDFSEAMVREAKKRSPGHVAFAVQDATALTYEDGTFDVVLMANALHVMPEPEKALREIRRVLRPGGILLAPTFVYDGPVHRFRLWVLHQAGFRTYHAWTSPELRDFVEAAGFETQELTVLPGSPLVEAMLAARKIQKE